MSGNKTVKFNTREKVLSEDVNKAQALGNRGLMEVARHLFSTLHNGKEDVQYVTTGAPLRALVLSGLCVLPQMASFDLYISAGAACTTETQVDPNNSPLCFAELTSNAATPGALVLSPNPAGSVRVDVVEFSRVDETFAIENRDIYNESTRVFDAVSVPKIVGSRLVFRVRQGVPGAGYPGHASGWCPLAIACHAPGSTTNDNVEFFDVRPLVSDRENLTIGTLGYDWRDSTYAGALNDLKGVVSAFLDGVRVGGALGTSEVNAAAFSPVSAVNQVSGFAIPGGSQFIYFYMLFPEGLPRWARYFPAASGVRLPSDFKGIPVAALTAPTKLSVSSSNLLPPASTGLLTATPGYMFGLIATAAAGGPGPFVAATKTAMRKKSYIEIEGYLGEVTSLAVPGNLPIPANTRRVQIVNTASVSGIPSGKVGGFKQIVYVADANNTSSQSGLAVEKSTGGDVQFAIITEHDVAQMSLVGVSQSASMLNLTDAAVWVLGYTHTAYAQRLQF